MDFVVVCPHCDAYIGIDRHSFFDLDFFHHNGMFSANGILYCDKCDKHFSMDVHFEPTGYNISQEVEY